MAAASQLQAYNNLKNEEEDMNEIKGLEEDLKKMFPSYTVEVSAPYASYVEYGTDPHPVSKEGIEELKEWARLKLSLSEEEAESAAYAIANKIRTSGTDPQPFFRPAIQEVEAMIAAGEFDDAENPIMEIARELAGLMVDKINDNGTANEGTLGKSVGYRPSSDSD